MLQIVNGRSIENADAYSSSIAYGNTPEYANLYANAYSTLISHY